MSSTLSKSALLLLACGLSATEAGLGYKCPDPVAAQAKGLAENFDLSLFTGPQPYYELAVHDATQPKVCGCTRSIKTLVDEQPRIQDNFTMACPWGYRIPSKVYESDLLFNTSANPGVLQGKWAVAKNVVFPDSVVDVGRTPGFPNAPYRWALEFQCVEKDEEAAFFAVNFYSRAAVGAEAETNFNEMMEAARVAEIDQYWNTTKKGLRRNNHTGCIYS